MATSTSALSPKAQQAWSRLHAVAELVPTAIDAQLRRDAGITRYEYYVLRMLSKAPDRAMPMSELARATNGSVSRLSHAAGHLEEEGWIVREPVPGNRRSTVAVLTDAGVEKLQRSTPAHLDAIQALIFAPLTEDQIVALDKALEPLTNALHLNC